MSKGGGWGERKRTRAGHDGGEKREERPFPSSHHPLPAFYFPLPLFFWDTQREPLRRREGFPLLAKPNTSKFKFNFWLLTLDVIADV